MRLIDWWFLDKLLYKRDNEKLRKDNSIGSLLWQLFNTLIGIIISLIVLYYCVKLIVFIINL